MPAGNRAGAAVPGGPPCLAVVAESCRLQGAERPGPAAVKTKRRDRVKFTASPATEPAATPSTRQERAGPLSPRHRA